MTAKEKVDCFGLHFSRKCSLGANDVSTASSPGIRSRNSPGLSHTHHFRESNVRRLLSKLEISKATGPDNVPCRVLKECSAALARPVTNLFRLIFNTGKQPDSWKVTRVVPVHKRSSKSKARNYRPVSLLAVLSKVFESIVNHQLVSSLEKHTLLSSHQFGFRRGLGTSDLLTALHHQWATAAGLESTVRMLAVDIAGAFDRVSHTGLLLKLKHYGIGSKCLTWMESYLSRRCLEVVVDGQTSSRFPICAGVPQGSILGPTLFLIYVNDLENHLPPSIQLATYADDTTL